MDTKELIGLEACRALEVLQQSKVTSFKFVYYSDRKQQKFDRELVTAVKEEDGCLILVVCRYQFDVE